MQSDEMIWQVINFGHCSFKHENVHQNFCRNEYNITGLCNRSSCPLANSNYATIREVEGKCYLFIKTIERAHSPKNLWQKIKLSRNYQTALEQIDQNLQYWPKSMVHKNKQRLTKITQYLIRMRRLQTKVQPKIVTMPRKAQKVEKRREKKAEVAAKVDKNIEQELLNRLKSGIYGDMYNFPLQEYQKVLQNEEQEQNLNQEMEQELEQELEYETENEQENVNNNYNNNENEDFDQYIENDDQDSSAQEEDIDGDDYNLDTNSLEDQEDIDLQPVHDQQNKIQTKTQLKDRIQKKQSTKKEKGQRWKNRKHVEIEYEQELQPQQRQLVQF